MNTKRGQSSKGKSVASGSKFDVNQLNQAVHKVKLDATHHDGWEVTSDINKNKTVWGPQTGGRLGGVGVYNPTSSAIRPPLHGAWNRNPRPAWRRVNTASLEPPSVLEKEVEQLKDTEQFVDSDYDDDDERLSDGYDSDEAPTTHEEKKKNKWYVDFFVALDKLSVEQMNKPTRQWHCPACKNGPGATNWYQSLHALLNHAKTIGSKRVKIHRNFAQVLEEELRKGECRVIPTRGCTIIPENETYGKSKVLSKVVTDREIVWPPMVIIMNTQLEQGEDDKWIGMGNKELVDYFGSYGAAKARHAYGPRGHMGMSVLIFERSAVGFTEAERLSNYFEQQGTNRDAWDHRPVKFLPGGQRQLYGYMATKSDIDFFNQCCKRAKDRLKFEMVSYIEKVVNQLKQMQNQE